MSARFFNMRTAQETLERMVFSVVRPRNPLSYTQSCYGHVCHAIRTDETLGSTDEVVFLGSKASDGVVHSVLMRDGKFLVDACSNNARLKGGVYLAPSTKGAQPIKMHVKGRASMEEFGLRCLDLLNHLESGATPQYSQFKK